MEILILIWNIFLFLLVLTAIISIHELGHYLLARRAGILIHEFSIGMGPVIVQKKKGETFYSLRAIPLGGYVAMSGENGDNALIAVGSYIGLNLNEIGLVKDIILDQTIANPSITGEVLAFDLYGKDLSQLFIELKTAGGEVNRYQVTRDARYLYGKKKELQITPHESSFASKTIWERFLVLFFGPLMNFLLAILVLFIVAIIQGKPLENNVVETSANEALVAGDVITSIDGLPVENIHEIRAALDQIDSHIIEVELIRDGVPQTTNVYVALVLQNFGFVNDTRADFRDELYIGGVGAKPRTAGLNAGDLITRINETDVTTWAEVLAIAKNYTGSSVTVYVLRDGEALSFSYDVLSEEVLNAIGTQSIIVRMGFSLGYEFDFLYLFTYPFQQFGSSVTEMLATLGLLFNPNSGVGVGDLAGPVGIFSLVSNAASAGFVSLMIFVAFLSVNIGLLNLLPIPALDGGRIIFLGYEAVTKKKIPAKVELWVNNIFFILLMVLFVFVTWNDIVRLFA